MSETVTTPPSTILTLPGFLSDALPFAARTALSLLLAYFVAFAAQVQSASTAGICVAIVAQPAAGMAVSKATYRMLGTVVGGAAGFVLVAAFPQDRATLLAGYALWLGLCAFVAALLRDFRSYGAVLSGYTAGIIAIGVIDAPQTALITALDRVAAMIIGVLAVLAVNSVLTGAGAFDALVAALRERSGTVTAIAIDALEGQPPTDDLALARAAGEVAALQTQAVYAAAEMPDGQVRSNGARHVIEALLATISLSRDVARALGPDTPPAVRAYLRAAAETLRGGEGPPGPVPVPTGPVDALLLDSVDDLLDRRVQALAGLRTLEEGGPRLPRIRVQVSYDATGALLGAVRAVIAIGLCSVFTVLAGWSGATLLLIQSSAIIALLGAVPDPSKASLTFLPPLLPMALVVGLAKFVALPSASGFAPFAVVVGPIAFAAALMLRQPRLAPYAPPTLLYLTLLLGPSNPQTFDLASYCNTVLQVGLALAFVVLAFLLVLPVSPPRRLYRVAAQLGRGLRRVLREEDNRRYRPGPALSLLYDRMSRALTWLGRPTPARQRLLGFLYGMGEAAVAVRRARSRLAAVPALEPPLRAAVATARRSLATGDAAAVLRSAEALLDAAAQHGDAAEGDSRRVRQAAAAMAAAALLLSRPRLMRFYRRLMT